MKFGFLAPILADADGGVIAGHARLQAATALRLTEVPVVIADHLTPAEARAYLIADNQLSLLAGWDDELLLSELTELSALGFDSNLLGFSDDELEALLDSVDAREPNVVDDQGPEPPSENPVARLGDLWKLGDHDLLCGDSTNPDDVARVLQDEKAQLLATDPPYCVNYTGDDRPIHDGKSSGKDWSDLYREVDIADLGSFLDNVLKAVLPHVDDGAAVYMWHAHVQQPTIAAVFERHDLLLHQILVWVKPTATFGHCYYRWQHEPCAFGWKRGNKPNHGFGAMTTVWQLDWEGKARIATFHPTSKPPRLFEIPMEQHTHSRAIVLEPFNGSGSQIIAAEKLGRRCRAIEIQPAFVDGTIARFEKATGKKAKLDGKTFEEVRAARMGE